jgi:hypothetical protein
MMRHWFLVGVFGLLVLAGCQKSTANDNSGSGRGRYIGVGVYAPGRMWRQIARSGPSADAAVATIKDDEQVIVSVDSTTGELRQCGNMSGFCTTMNPWANALPSARHAPTTLVKHAELLDQEEAAEQAKQSAAH